MLTLRPSRNKPTYLENLAFPGKIAVTLVCIKKDNALSEKLLTTMVRDKAVR